MKKDSAKKLSISMPESLYKKMRQRMERLRIQKDSAYIQLLVDQDVVLDQNITRVAEKPTTPYGKK